MAGELQSPKNMTIGSKSPKGVEKAAFQQSSGRMRILLYLHRTSNLVNILLSFNLSINSEMRGSE